MLDSSTEERGLQPSAGEKSNERMCSCIDVTMTVGKSLVPGLARSWTRSLVDQSLSGVWQVKVISPDTRSSVHVILWFRFKGQYTNTACYTCTCMLEKDVLFSNCRQFHRIIRYTCKVEVQVTCKIQKACTYSTDCYNCYYKRLTFIPGINSQVAN